MLVLLAIVLWFPLSAQEPDSDTYEPGYSVYVHAESSPTGNVTFNVSPDADDEETKILLDAVPGALGCKWITLDRSEYSLNGMCRG